MTTTMPDVPTGFRADAWQDDTPQPYRVLFGELRGIDGVGLDRVNVQPTAVQFADGRIDDGSVHEPPHVYLCDDALTSVEARELAVALIETADEVDGWAQR